MKALYFILVAGVFLSTLRTFAQENGDALGREAQLGAVATSPVEKRLEWRPNLKDWWSTEWEASDVVTNSAGTPERNTRRFVEVGGALNYLDEEGTWRRSVSVIEILTNNAAGGAAALRGPTKVYFPAALS